MYDIMSTCKNITFLHTGNIQSETKTKVIIPFIIASKVTLYKSNNSSFPGGALVKNLSANSRDLRDVGLIPGSGRSLGEWHGNSLQYSCLENPVNKGAWWAIYSP